jgi:histone H3/H4
MDVKFWKKCSICKKDIGFSDKYYLCSVSTCKHPRKGFRFCSVDCWDAHLGFTNHRESWAEDAVAPTRNEFLSLETQMDSTRSPKRTVITDTPKSTHQTTTFSSPKMRSARNIKTETLVVVSKVKTLIKEQADMSTSQCFIDALTEKVVEHCLDAIENAKTAGRKTVMGRDLS